jgi:flagellar biosynthesis component FlhA
MVPQWAKWSFKPPSSTSQANLETKIPVMSLAAPPAAAPSVFCFFLGSVSESSLFLFFPESSSFISLSSSSSSESESESESEEDESESEEDEESESDDEEEEEEENEEDTKTDADEDGVRSHASS